MTEVYLLFVIIYCTNVLHLCIIKDNVCVASLVCGNDMAFTSICLCSVQVNSRNRTTMHRDGDHVGPVRVVLLGHSYVRRLDEYMQLIPSRWNLRFATVDVTVHCVAWGLWNCSAWTMLHSHLLQDVVALNPLFLFTLAKMICRMSHSLLFAVFTAIFSSVFPVSTTSSLWASCYHSRAVHVTTRLWLLPTNGWLMYPVIQVSSGAIAVGFSSLLLPGSSYQTAFI